MLLCEQNVLKKETKAEKSLLYRSVKLDAVDEKIELLGEKGIFIIGSEIDQSTVGGLFVNVLPKLSCVDKKPIWVILDSPGGSISQGFAVHDFLKTLTLQGWEVNVLGLGEVVSMAVCIMQAATRRYAFPNTQFMVHQASLHSEGEQISEVNKLTEDARELKRLNHIVLKIIAERSGMEMRQLLKLSKKTDCSMDALNAKNFGKNGLIDEIVDKFPFQL